MSASFYLIKILAITIYKKFNLKRSSQIHRWIDSGEPKNWPGVAEDNIVTHQYRIGSLADSVSGSLGKKYLEDNWKTDTLNNS